MATNPNPPNAIEAGFTARSTLASGAEVLANRFSNGLIFSMAASVAGTARAPPASCNPVAVLCAQQSTYCRAKAGPKRTKADPMTSTSSWITAMLTTPTPTTRTVIRAYGCAMTSFGGSEFCTFDETSRRTVPPSGTPSAASAFATSGDTTISSARRGRAFAPAGF